ncbi:MAG: hypothetical protein RBS80_16535 [Thermoguttaceae bacterium]|jgi:hypothetical protein|nr:hypothetical protein [Thermoguttaceae bacterium]
MDDVAWLIVGGVVIALVVVTIVVQVASTRAARRRRDHLRMRPVHSLVQWYEQSYKPAGVRFCSALLVAERLAKCLGCHVTQLLATDRFAGELAIKGLSCLALGSDDEMDAFEVEIYNLVGKSVGSLPLHTAETVVDLVRICDEFIHRKPEP